MAVATPAQAWAAAVELGARGSYAEAESLVAPLASARDPWSSLALSLLASHQRQIGAIDESMRLDTAALHEARDAEARADALTGLAADAVASGDIARAGAWHDEAAPHASHDWRTLTRWHWVGAERALLAGDPSLAAHLARQALDACQRRSPRHEAKSRIVLAAASGGVSDLPDVSPVLRAEGWVTLEWPLALVAADYPDQVTRAWLAGAWEAGRGATYAIEKGLPEGAASVWRAHPGVRRLRADGPATGGG